MKTITLLALAAALASCVPGLEIVTQTPYGSGSYKNGTLNVAPNPTPFQIQIQGTK